MRRLLVASAVPLMLGLIGCSGTGTPAGSASATDVGQASQPADTTEVQPSEPQDSPQSTPAGAAPGAGSITLAIGDETWEFGGALCAYQGAPAGEPGSEWNVSFKEGNNQVYVSDDSYGPRVSITDVVDVGALEWVAEGDAVTLTVDGNDISATGSFTDLTGEQQDGTLTATCPSWVGP